MNKHTHKHREREKEFQFVAPLRSFLSLERVLASSSRGGTQLDIHWTLLMSCVLILALCCFYWLLLRMKEMKCQSWLDQRSSISRVTGRYLQESKHHLFLLSRAQCFSPFSSSSLCCCCTIVLHPLFQLLDCRTCFLLCTSCIADPLSAVLHLHSSSTFSTHSCITYLSVQKFRVKCPLSLAHRERCAEYKWH